MKDELIPLAIAEEQLKPDQVPVQEAPDNAGAAKQNVPPPFNLSELPELSCCYGLVAGVDEVGRGALFGPVVAAAVILPVSAFEELTATLGGIKDSKQLSRSRRAKLAAQIQAVALDWKIGFASPREIDEINIFQASLLAMKRAVCNLAVQPELCLVDGKWLLPDLPMPQMNLVKGDERSLVIAAASIVAKVWRDELLSRLAQKYSVYDLVNNKGYGTQRHLLALQQHGPSPLHRMSFSPCQKAVSFTGQCRTTDSTYST